MSAHLSKGPIFETCGYPHQPSKHPTFRNLHNNPKPRPASSPESHVGSSRSNLRDFRPAAIHINQPSKYHTFRKLHNNQKPRSATSQSSKSQPTIDPKQSQSIVLTSILRSPNVCSQQHPMLSHRPICCNPNSRRHIVGRNIALPIIASMSSRDVETTM